MVGEREISPMLNNAARKQVLDWQEWRVLSERRYSPFPFLEAENRTRQKYVV